MAQTGPMNMMLAPLQNRDEAAALDLLALNRTTTTTTTTTLPGLRSVTGGAGLVPPPFVVPSQPPPPFSATAESLKRRHSLSLLSENPLDALPPPKRRFSVCLPSAIHLQNQSQNQSQNQNHTLARHVESASIHQPQNFVSRPSVSGDYSLISSVHENGVVRRGSVASLVSVDSESDGDSGVPNGAGSTHSLVVQGISGVGGVGGGGATTREAHKYAERARRTRMNDLFNELKNLLPPDAFADCKASKLDILAKTVEHLTHTNELLRVQSLEKVESGKK